MDKLSTEQADSVNKMSSDAIKAELTKLGYQQEVISGFGREQLKAHLAAHILEQQGGASAHVPGTTSEAVALRQIQLRELELKTQTEHLRMQLEQQRLQFEQEKLRVQAEAELNRQRSEVAERAAAAARETELQRERLRLEAATAAREAEAELNRQRFEDAERARVSDLERERMRLQTQEHIRREELRVKEALGERDQQTNAMSPADIRATRLKRYSDAIRGSIYPMPDTVIDIPSYWDNIDHLYEQNQVPNEFRAQLIKPLLNKRARHLISNLTAIQSDDYDYLKKYLNEQFKLTSREYRSMFKQATKKADETHVMFVTRLNIFT